MQTRFLSDYTQICYLKNERSSGPLWLTTKMVVEVEEELEKEGEIGGGGRGGERWGGGGGGGGGRWL